MVGEVSRFSSVRKPHSETPDTKMAADELKAIRELKEAEASALAAETWLKEVVRKVTQEGYSEDDAAYLRGLLGSERFEEGSVAFLNSVMNALEETMPEGDPNKVRAAELRLSASRLHLEALGKRLAGLRLLLKGPKPLHSTPPQA